MMGLTIFITLNKFWSYVGLELRVYLAVMEYLVALLAYLLARPTITEAILP